MEFTSFKRNKDGLQSYCKPCKALKLREYRKNKNITEEERLRKKEYDKQYNKTNREKKLEQLKKYRLNNSEKIKKSKIDNKEKYRKTLNEWARKYAANRIITDPIFKLKRTIRNRLRSFLKTKNLEKTKQFVDYIGCTVGELKQHLESKFKDGMTWENHGKWHLDHIIPLSSASTEEDIYMLNHYTNLQPLWAEENLKKGSKT
jgi:hypothetical protein